MFNTNKSTTIDRIELIAKDRRFLDSKTLTNFITSNILKFKISNLDLLGEYFWVVKSQPKLLNIDSLHTGTFTLTGSDTDQELDIPLIDTKYSAGNTYYFGLRKVGGDEVIQISFTISQNTVLATGTDIINNLPGGAVTYNGLEVNTTNNRIITEGSLELNDITVFNNLRIPTNLAVQTYVASSIAGKEDTITAGTTLQYYRGDKTFQTLNTSVVPENTNLYFTEARVRSTPLAGFTATNTPITSTDTVLQAFGKAQGQINQKVSLTGNETVAGVKTFSSEIIRTATDFARAFRVFRGGVEVGVIDNGESALRIQSLNNGLFLRNQNNQGLEITPTNILRIFGDPYYKGVVTVGSANNNDYVTDGTADEVEINLAITQANSQNKKILIRSGSYNLADQIILRNNTYLEGQDGVVLNLDNSVNKNIFINIDTAGGNNNIVLKNFKINGNRANQTTGNAIQLTNVSDFKIEKVELVEIQNDGFSLTLCQKGLIEGCRIMDIGNIAINDGEAVVIRQSNNIIVKDNFADSTVGDTYLAKNNSTNIWFVNNTANNIQSAASTSFVATDEDGLPCSSIYFINNKSFNSAGKGISIDNSTNCVITGNVIDRCALDGMWFRGSSRNIITNNIVRDSSFGNNNIYNGIVLFENSSSIGSNNNNVSNNIINETISNNARYGILENATCNNNNFIGNTISGGLIGALSVRGVNSRKAKNTGDLAARFDISNANTEQFRQLLVNNDLGFSDRQLKNAERTHDLYFETFGFSEARIIFDPKTGIRSSESNSTLYNIGDNFFGSNFSLLGTGNNTENMVEPNIARPQFVKFTSADSQLAQSLDNIFYNQGVVVAILRTPTPTQQQVVFAKGGGIRSFINVDRRLSLNGDTGFIAGTTQLQPDILYHIVYAWDSDSPATYKEDGETGGSGAIWLNGVRDGDGDGLTITTNTSFWTISRTGSFFANFDLFHFSILNKTTNDLEVKDFFNQQKSKYGL